MAHDKKNIMVVLSSPSGAGKTTITKKIQQKFNTFKISVSHTTREPRPNEVDGIDYNFVTKENFKNLVENKKFYEYAKIFDNYYGTTKENIDKLILTNDIIFDIDWQGNKQLSNFKNLNLIKIYITTTDKKELKSRLLKRNQDSEQEVEKRLKSFEEDTKHWNDYDYIVINENLENCFRQIVNIIKNHKQTNYLDSNNSTIL
jgi:guanylate kinase